MKKLSGILLLSGLVLISACSMLKPVNLLNAVVPDEGYSLQAGISYGDLPRQRLDIYLPQEPVSASRTIVFVYGGAWRQGNRSEYRFLAQALANAGHTVIIPDYRLYPNVRFPDFINDVADAIRAVKDHDRQWLAYSLEEVVLMGHSSGAHSVSLLASDSSWLSDSGVSVAGLIALAGPYDLPLDDPEVVPVFDEIADPDLVHPIALADSSHPPTLLIHGADDERVLPFHTHDYAAALVRVGVPVDKVILEGVGHVSVLSNLATPLDRRKSNLARLTGFLNSLQ